MMERQIEVDLALYSESSPEDREHLYEELREHGFAFTEEGGVLKITLPESYNWHDATDLMPDIMNSDGELIAFYDPDEKDLVFY